MKATWQGHLIAESDQTIELDGYQYFPPASVRMEYLQAAPHSSERAACAYQAPRSSHARIAHWIGFWNDVDLQH